MTTTQFNPTREQVIKTLKKVYSYAINEALRYGPQKPDEDFIATLEYLKREFNIEEEELK
jgi:hypothetical protein